MNGVWVAIEEYWLAFLGIIGALLTNPEFANLRLLGLSVLLAVYIWGSFSISRRWPENVRRLILLSAMVALSAAIVYADQRYQSEGVATISLALVAAFTFWNLSMLHDHQKKFLEHEEHVLAIFEHNHGLNQEARQLHALTLIELKKAQDHLVGRFIDDSGFYSAAYKSKYEQICSQIAAHEVYVRYTEFKELWKKLVDISTSYTSVCDLSFYSKTTIISDDRRTRQLFEKERRYWTERVQGEIAELIRNKKNTRTFHKVIVYSPLEMYDEPNIRPPCNDVGNRCDYAKCGKTCIVKLVTQMWKEAGPQFEANVLGLSTRERGSQHVPFIWLVQKEVIDTKFLAIRSLDSVDVGLFDEFVGEEFKIPAGTGEPRIQDYLARIRYDPDLAKRIHAVCNEMRLDGQLLQC